MVSGAEIPGLCLIAPQAIEAIVKAIRLARDWADIDEELKHCLWRGIVTSENLDGLAGDIATYMFARCANGDSDLDPEVVLQERLATALEYCKKANQILQNWDKRLHGKSTPPATAAPSTNMSSPSDTKSMDSERTKIAEPPNIQADAALSSYTSSPKSFNSILRKPRQTSTLKTPSTIAAGDASSRSRLIPALFSLPRKARHATARIFFKAAFLALGAREITSALSKMDICAHEIRNTIDTLLHRESRQSWGADAISYIRDAKKREADSTSVSCVAQTSLTCVPMDPSMENGFWLVIEGEFKGCVVEDRDVRRLMEMDRVQQALEDTERIVRFLSSSSEICGVGLLRCRGYCVVLEEDKVSVNRHQLIYRKVPGTKPRTLRSVLCDTDTLRHPLDDRIYFALKLAISVHIIHSAGLVHKAIRPDSILVMEPLSSSNRSHYQLGIPFLAGFNTSRSMCSDSDMGNLSDAENIAFDLYQHPDHLPDRQDKYEIRHDIYSLGVCLLEIGLWKSFFRSDEKHKCYQIDRRWSFFEPREASDDGSINEQLYCERKDELIKVAKSDLPPIMGLAFTDVVVYCLNFVESDRNDPNKGAYRGAWRFLQAVVSELFRIQVSRSAKC